MKVSLPSADPNEYHDVKCIAEVGNRLWIGAGPSIFLLDEQTLERQVHTYTSNCVRSSSLSFDPCFFLCHYL